MTRLAAAVARLLLAGAALAACGGDDSGDDAGDGGLSASDGAAADGSDAEAPDTEAPDDAVVITTDPAPVSALDNSFMPENIQVKAGTEVVWTNKGRNEHNALHVDGGDWGVEVDDFQPGDVYSHTFDEPGVYRYYCSIHGSADAGMIGTVVVTD
ncbi:MAG TPA: plastocyanin/azurin family copper-binding protein [Acidimicrobiales bacterium]|jgi:plastocyanin|nr:plastocyanin/azurin family copper-binding protein [Acidimicrobiales bacterium]